MCFETHIATSLQAEHGSSGQRPLGVLREKGLDVRTFSFYVIFVKVPINMHRHTSATRSDPFHTVPDRKQRTRHFHTLFQKRSPTQLTFYCTTHPDPTRLLESCSHAIGRSLVGARPTYSNIIEILSRAVPLQCFPLAVPP